MLGIKNEIGEIYQGVSGKPLYRPLFLTRVQAGFPSPADDWIADRISFDHDFIKHPLATFFVRVTGDSMEPLIQINSLLVVDKMEEAGEGDIVVVCLNNDMCVKRISFDDENGEIWLFSENKNYPPFRVRDEDNFSVWGTVIHIIHPLRGKNKVSQIRTAVD